MPSNPYTPSRRALFYGREELIRSLLSDEQQGQSVILIGGRRCGKTRVLEQIRLWLKGCAAGAEQAALWKQTVPDAADAAPPSAMRPHWPVLISVEGQALPNLEAALEFLVTSITDSLTEGGYPIETPPPLEISSSSVERWLLRLDTYLAARQLGGLALLIDEVEVLFRAPWCHDLMSFLRVLDDRVLQTRVFFVLTGRHGLDNYINPVDGSPPLNTLRRTLVRDLGYQARKRMCLEPFTAEDYLPPSDTSIREVDRWAAGNVWLLTLLLEQAFHSAPLSPERVNEIADGLMDDLQVQDSFRRWLDALTDAAREIYQAVAARGVVSTGDHVGGKYVRARLRLEYQALVHRVGRDQIELGPELFRRWAVDEGIVRPPFTPRRIPVGETDAIPPGHYRYELALSYAAPQRELARRLADHCRGLNLRVFYDRDLGHELWGANLATVLPGSYDRESLLTVLLVSEDYVNRRWPQVEARAAVSKAIREGWPAVLLASVDGARLPDVPDSVVWLDLNQPGKESADIMALEVAKRLQVLQTGRSA